MTRRNTQPRRRLAFLVAIAMLGGVLSASFGGAHGAHAVSAAGFNPGNIITDAEFYNGKAASAAEVQEFLNQQVPRCTIGDSGRAAGSSWGSTAIAAKCLRNFTMTTTSKAANAYCGAYSGRSNETAAQIIARVGQACGISPKVLLVMLQKEQSLVQDTWPTVRQFEVAMGYGCPDSGPNYSANCDANYSGFYNQVYRAAWQLKVYKALPGNYSYKAGQWNRIQWHPDPACGSSSVYIENSATAALYIYTPYRPNQAALDAEWGAGDSCSSYGNRNFFLYYYSWFGGEAPAQDRAVIGDVNSVSLSNGTLSVRGWAVDPDASGAIDAHVYIGSRGYSVRADQARPDVASAYPAYGANHGFVFSTSAAGLSGVQQVCVYGIGVGANGAKNGANPRLASCANVDFTAVREQGRAPVGDMNSATVSKGKLSVSGWALDPDTVEPIDVHVYVGTKSYAVRADRNRADVAAVHRAYGARHGFEFALDVSEISGEQQVCVYGINSVSGYNPKLACKTVDFGTLQELGRAPIGDVNGASVRNGTLTVSGWALDPDTKTPIDVHVYVGPQGHAVVADRSRPDVAAAYPGYGESHGFVFSRDVSGLSGEQQVCVYGINSVSGYNPKISCSTVDFGGVPEKGRAPIGDVNGTTVSNGVLTVRGWALDPDTYASIDVHVYIGLQGYAVRADQSRPDVAAAYPGYGESHGFVFSRDVSGLSGEQQVCVYGINSVSGYNPKIGCRTVTL